MDNQLLTVSPSPHIHSKYSINMAMSRVIMVLIPALIVSIYFFGIGAVIVTGVAMCSCIIFEILIKKYIFREHTLVSDCSALLTGLLLAFNLPSNLPVWIVILGSFVAIGVGKMTFGGLGKNPFNPALVGRVFLLICFPVEMTSWPLPLVSRLSYMDAVTGATPLGIMKEGFRNTIPATEWMAQIPSHIQMFIGEMGGSMGEISGLVLILGGIYLIVTRIISWHIPVSIILTVLIFTGLFWVFDPIKYPDPIFHVLTGGVLLGSFFMATDYVTSPMTPIGMCLYGIGIGIITVVIRNFGAYPEGVSFAILIMNGFVPLINKYMKPKRYGERLSYE